MSVNVTTSVVYGFVDVSDNISDELFSLAEEEGLDFLEIYDETILDNMKKTHSIATNDPTIFFIGFLQAELSQGMSVGSLTSTLSLSDEDKEKVDEFIANHYPQYKAETHLVVRVS